MWEETKIETYLNQQLHTCYNKQDGDFYFSLYSV